MAMRWPGSSEGVAVRSLKADGPLPFLRDRGLAN